MGLLSAVEQLKPGDRFPVELRAAGCLHSLNKLASCEACFTVCPVGAIQPGKPPALDSLACAGCNACLAACPAGAFVGDDQARYVLLAAARAVEKYKVHKIDLLCQQLRRPGQGSEGSNLGLRVPGCLAQLGAGTYLALAVLGIQEITVRLDDCAGCAWSDLRNRIQKQVAGAKALFRVWGLDSAVGKLEAVEDRELVDRPGWNASSPPLSRTELLRPAPLLAESRFAELFSHGAANDRHLSSDRSRQRAAIGILKEMERQVGDADTPVPGAVQIQASESCNGCGICAQACPTEALQRTLCEGKEYHLIFSPQACVDCKVCTAICPEQALTLEQPAFAGYLLEREIILHSGNLVSCQKCRILFSPKAGEELCPPCKFRRENPFGARQVLKNHD